MLCVTLFCEKKINIYIDIKIINYLKNLIYIKYPVQFLGEEGLKVCPAGPVQYFTRQMVVRNAGNGLISVDISRPPRMRLENGPARPSGLSNPLACLHKLIYPCKLPTLLFCLLCTRSTPHVLFPHTNKNCNCKMVWFCSNF